MRVYLGTTTDAKNQVWYSIFAFGLLQSADDVIDNFPERFVNQVLVVMWSIDTWSIDKGVEEGQNKIG